MVHVGISGWTYAPWRGVFYPDDLPQHEELAWASRRFSSIEVNGTFYRLQTPETFRAWYAATPPDFRFAVKGGQYITHFRHLVDVRVPLANFFASGILALAEKLGPILWQLPPNLRYQPERIDAFLELLPRSQADAARLGEEHDRWMADRAWLDVRTDRPLRHALEVRNKTFLDPRFIASLRRAGVALVFADTAGKWPYTEDVTADFVYARLHGDVEIYASGYTPEALDRWARRFATWQAGGEPDDANRVAGPASPMKRDVYVYFDNDVKVRAPFDATGLARRLTPALV